MSRIALLIVTCLFALACGPEDRGRPLTVAAASSVADAVGAIAREFERETGNAVDLTTGSTGVLALQLREGAPFDLFLGADSETAERLASDGFLDPESLAVYTTGELVLWQPENDAPPLSGAAGLMAPQWADRRIAIANPETAPYGRAALRVVERIAPTGALASRLVYAGDVKSAWQIAASGNADAAFVAISVLRPEDEPRVLRLNEYEGTRIAHTMGIAANSLHPETAERFAAHLRASDAARRIAADFRAPALATIDWRPVWISIHVSVAATVLAVVLGSLLGWMLAQRRFPGQRLFEAAVLLPLVLPPTVLGYFLLVAIGADSAIGRLWEALFGAPLAFTVNAAIVAASVATIPIVARQLAAAFSISDPEVTEAARLAGASGWNLFWHVHLPQIRAPLVAAATIAFARAMGDFGTTLMVAGSLPGRTQTASLAIYDYIVTGRDHEAMVLVVLVSILALVTLVVTQPREN